MRLRLVCRSAARLPSVIVSTASTARASSHGLSWLSRLASTRNSAVNAATFVATDMNAVTGVGAPW